MNILMKCQTKQLKKSAVVGYNIEVCPHCENEINF